MCRYSINSTLLANTGLVSNINNVTETSNSTNKTSSVEKSGSVIYRQQLSPFVEKTSFNRLVDLRARLQSQGFSNQCIDIINASWREGTKKQYQYAWSLWSKWCVTKNINPMDSSVQDLLNFLSVQFHSGKSYSILNTYRSAISSIHNFVDGSAIGKHALVSRFFKGLATLKPSLPRYQMTWDVNQVLLFLESWWPLDGLSLKTLTLRTVALVAITSAQRSQTIQLLDISFMRRVNQGLHFTLNKLTKTDKPGKFNSVFFPMFMENEKLCVVKTLLAYIKKTTPVRKSNQLFISFRKPFLPVSTATLARWLLEVLQLAGINTQIYKAHSYRSAASSYLFRKGLSVKQIMDKCFWKCDTTFYKFYLRQVATQASS